MTFKRIITTFAVSTAMIGGAGGVMFACSGSALAPEPAWTTASVPSTYGQSGSAVYMTSRTPTKVTNWTSTSYAGTTSGVLPAAGTPCWDTHNWGPLPAGYEVDDTIVASGSTRICA